MFFFCESDNLHHVLASIKNVWALFKSRINKRRPRPLIKQERSNAIEERRIGYFYSLKIIKLQLIACLGVFN